MMRKILNFFKSLFPSKTINRYNFPIGSYILHIPEFVDVMELGRVTHYDSFGNPVTNKFVGYGYCIVFSPIAFQALQKLTPIERLAIFSQYLLPIHDMDRTLNFETITIERISEETLAAAITWYEEQPINQIELISDVVSQPVTNGKRSIKKRKPRMPKEKVIKKIPIVSSEPKL